MPPPFRQPSQTGASAATKRAFKPPGVVKGAASSSSSATSRSHQGQKQTAASGPGRATSWNNKPGGFQSAAQIQIDDADLEAMVVSSEDDDEDDDFSAALSVAATSKRTCTTTAPVTTTDKRQKTTVAPRLRSLSPMTQSSPPRLPSPDPNPVNDNGTTAQPPAIGGASDDIPLLPTPLLTRLLHESFNEKSTKITKDANTLMARYLDVFVREAVARANEVVKERKMVSRVTGEDPGDVWLDVADLDEVAPGLILDF